MTEIGAHIPIIYHFAMLQDQPRMLGFKEAIETTVKEGDVVVELGGGSGVLSFYAAQKASKVICVEKIPENARYAREFLSKNNNGNRVEVICADAFEYLPDQPVDVVICEMLHVGMAREQQLAVIDSFKKRYLARFGGKLPKFIPEGFIQGVQPLEFDFNFYGYYAPIPLFQIPDSTALATKELAAPLVFQSALYDHSYSLDVSCNVEVPITSSGTFNALRLILKNLLAVVPQDGRGIFWHNQYLILPLQHSLSVEVGDRVVIGFSYPSGAELGKVIESVRCEKKGILQGLRSQIEVTRTPQEELPPASALDKKITSSMLET